MSNQFAAFIITYERPEALSASISKILAQTHPPAKLLILDNSLTDRTQSMAELWQNQKVEYYRVGYNAGPAGAARLGLEKLTNEGYHWVYWGDDDDPPKFPDSFSLIMNMVSATDNIGVAGAVGSRFNWSTGFLERLNDNELSGVIAVDAVAGGMTMFINTAVVRRGILPDDNLFFGFEELDFCLRVKKAGFTIAVNGELAHRSRAEAGRFNLGRGDRHKGWKFKKGVSSLWREYYSMRNFCYMMVYKYKKPRVVFVLLLRALFKMATGFRLGPRYGWVNGRVLLVALKDAFLKRMGRNDELRRIF